MHERKGEGQCPGLVLGRGVGWSHLKVELGRLGGSSLALLSEETLLGWGCPHQGQGVKATYRSLSDLWIVQSS